MIGPEEDARRIPLARHPNWTSQPEDHKAQWFTWTNDSHPFNPREGFSANDSQNLQGRDAEFVEDALIYSEFGWVMGTPYPTRVINFDPSDGSVRFANWTGGGNASVIFRGMRYYLEDKPQYLDDPQGAMGGSEGLHSIGRAGFGADYPELTEWIRNWTMDDEELASLQALTVAPGVSDPAAGARQWLAQNPLFLERTLGDDAVGLEF
jgi:hypothetical protein